MFRFNERGSAIQAIIFTAMILVISMVLIGVRTLRSQFVGRQLRDDMAQMQLSSAVETSILVLRLAEISYVDSVQNCGAAKPFLRALKEGSGCDSPMSLTIFSGNDAGTADKLYSYTSAGCTITESNSSCSTANRLKLFHIGGTTKAEALNGNTFDVYLLAVDTAKQVIDMLVEVTTADNKTFKSQFAVRATAANFAHLEGDGRVTQESPDPLSKCKGSPWADYSVFDSGTRKCQKFGQLGSGTGLAYYNGHYFGFRPADGMVVDLLALGGTGTSYIVEEDGSISGTKIFPAYSREFLSNVDDITVSNDQIHYVMGLGQDAQLGILVNDAGGFSRTTICPLGTKGWAQAYSGVAALSWNEPLYPLPTDPALTRIGMFMLKTDSGDLLTAVVRATSAGYSCTVFKEEALQQIEYKRTLGFDRTDDNVAFYIY